MSQRYFGGIVRASIACARSNPIGRARWKLRRKIFLAGEEFFPGKPDFLPPKDKNARLGPSESGGRRILMRCKMRSTRTSIDQFRIDFSDSSRSDDECRSRTWCDAPRGT